MTNQDAVVRIAGYVATVILVLGFFYLLSGQEAQAATTITTVADQTVFVGGVVDVEVVVNRTGILLQNDWESTEIDGTCFNDPDLTTGTGVASTTFGLGVATTTPGTYSIDVRVFRFNGCDDNFGFAGSPAEDSTSFELEVKAKPAPSSSSSSEGSSSGGGSLMTPAYYGFSSEADKARWKNYDERQKMIGEWRWKMCQEVGFACGK